MTEVDTERWAANTLPQAGMNRLIAMVAEAKGLDYFEARYEVTSHFRTLAQEAEAKGLASAAMWRELMMRAHRAEDPRKPVENPVQPRG